MGEDFVCPSKPGHTLQPPTDSVCPEAGHTLPQRFLKSDDGEAGREGRMALIPARLTICSIGVLSCTAWADNNARCL